MGALERENVGRLLDDADQRAVTPCVAADLACLLLGPVAAGGAEADAFLRFLERPGELERLLLRRA